MKFLLVAVSGLVLFSNSLIAQDLVPPKIVNEVTLGGGVAYPAIPKEFRKFWKEGFGFVVGVGHTFQQGNLGYSGIHATIEYYRFSFSDEDFRNYRRLPASVEINGDPRSAFNVMLGYKGTFSNVSEAVQPYFQLGVGYYNTSSFSISVLGVNSSLTDTVTSALAWSFGVGLDFLVSEKITLFGESKFFLAATGDYGTQFFPVYVGLRYKP